MQSCYVCRIIALDVITIRWVCRCRRLWAWMASWVCGNLHHDILTHKTQNACIATVRRQLKMEKYFFFEFFSICNLNCRQSSQCPPITRSLIACWVKKLRFFLIETTRINLLEDFSFNFSGHLFLFKICGHAFKLGMKKNNSK